ncbi:MAG: winged helix-turn-helix domain-containing protein [Candidatus Bathyarchaeia archaeon]
MFPWTKDHSRRRDLLYIIADILDIAKNGASKTHILYKGNLSTKQLNIHLNYMIKNGLLTKNLETDRKVYRPTEKGLRFLIQYQEITAMLKCNEENGFKNGAKMPPFQLLANTNISQKIRTF